MVGIENVTFVRFEQYRAHLWEHSMGEVCLRGTNETRCRIAEQLPWAYPSTHQRGSDSYVRKIMHGMHANMLGKPRKYVRNMQHKRSKGASLHLGTPKNE